MSDQVTVVPTSDGYSVVETRDGKEVIRSRDMTLRDANQYAEEIQRQANGYAVYQTKSLA